MENTFKQKHDLDEFLVMASFRYALTRKSAGSVIVAEELVRIIDDLSETTLRNIVDEFSYELERKTLDEINLPYWSNLANVAQERLNDLREFN